MIRKLSSLARNRAGGDQNSEVIGLRLDITQKVSGIGMRRFMVPQRFMRLKCAFGWYRNFGVRLRVLDVYSVVKLFQCRSRLTVGLKLKVKYMK